MSDSGEFDELVEAAERLRLPVKVDAFNAVQFGKPDFAAMIVHEEEPGCMAIIAQQLSDQDAEDICTILNGAATAIQTLTTRLAEAQEVVTESNNSLYGSQGYFLSTNGDVADKYHLSRPIEELKSRLAESEAREKALRDAVIRHIPMDYLQRHDVPGATGPSAALNIEAALRDYAEDRWKLVERLRANPETDHG